jgi:putative cell wall-binding protein
MNRSLSLAAVVVLALASWTAVAATTTRTVDDKEKLGKLVIKTAPVPEGGFADPKLEDTVKDLKKNKRKFIIVDDEAEADFLIIVVERANQLRSPAGTVVNNKTVRATLSIKEDGKWKPAIKLEHGGGNFWELAASRVMEDAEKWIKKNVKNQP